MNSWVDVDFKGYDMKSPSVTHLRSGSELTLSKGFAAARQVQKKGLPEHYPCKRVPDKFETSSARAQFSLPQVPHIHAYPIFTAPTLLSLGFVPMYIA